MYLYKKREKHGLIIPNYEFGLRGLGVGDMEFSISRELQSLYKSLYNFIAVRSVCYYYNFNVKYRENYNMLKEETKTTISG